MKTKLLLAATLLVATLALTTHHYYRTSQRLREDRTALLARLDRQLSTHDSLRAHCEVLRLEREEFRRLYQAETERLKAMNIRLRRVESVAQSVSRNTLTLTAPLRDTVYITRTEPLCDTARHFRWEDPWNRVEAIIRHDSIHCRVLSIDTLHQVVHRIPHRFLFFRWGTKALRQEIRTSNPSTRIVYTDYVVIAR